ncbi:MAG TPA: hypothetical protein VFM98_22615 [Ramlibacter sp.]|uniref:hypothetical protein n=1 Tax=Ramlibacter sp. TaxID=1917967 RepID=UPI002D7E5D6E|nr:hypothetical protein [Ramlibacter sp.]HET8748407.1 hypothetical protein [Ramlibacter sp.]
MQRQDRAGPKRSEFVRWARAGVLAGIVVIVAVPMLTASWKRHHAAPPQASAPTQQMGAQPQPRVQLADFGAEQPSPDARLLANWVVATGNQRKHAFIVVDKKDARVYVFMPDGRLRDSAPVLLGEAHGDDVAPGVGDKPLEEVQPQEKTTPAGRFVAESGMNTEHEDVIWVDYDQAISMHRVRPWVETERRLERLASLTTDDNRISFGCINLPVRFYEDVAKPTVTQYGAIVYVLPEVKTLQQVFGAYDVTDPAQVAAARQSAKARPAVQG